jgi:hypothetical protein
MLHATPTPRCRPARRLRDDLSQAPGLPFADLLPAAKVQQALDQEPLTFRERLFSPLVTLWLFLEAFPGSDIAVPYRVRWLAEMCHPHYPSSDSLYPGRRAA